MAALIWKEPPPLTLPPGEVRPIKKQRTSVIQPRPISARYVRKALQVSSTTPKLPKHGLSPLKIAGKTSDENSHSKGLVELGSGSMHTAFVLPRKPNTVIKILGSGLHQKAKIRLHSATQKAYDRVQGNQLIRVALLETVSKKDHFHTAERIPTKIDPKNLTTDITKRISDIFVRMILNPEIYIADLTPDNVMLSAKNELVMVDPAPFGLGISSDRDDIIDDLASCLRAWGPKVSKLVDEQMPARNKYPFWNEIWLQSIFGQENV